MIFGRFVDYEEANNFKMEIVDIISCAIRTRLNYQCDIFISRSNESNTYHIGLCNRYDLESMKDKLLNLLEKEFGIKKENAYLIGNHMICYNDISQETVDCIYLLKRLGETI